MSPAREMTCIVCPRGCSLRVEPAPGGSPAEAGLAPGAAPGATQGAAPGASAAPGAAPGAAPVTPEILGAACRRGRDYALGELADPRRVLTSTVRTSSARLPRLPVRSSAPLPLGRLLEAARALDAVLARPPLKAGEPLLRDLLGLGVDILAADDLQEEVR